MSLQWFPIFLADHTAGKFLSFFGLTRCVDSTMKTDAQLLPPVAVKEEEIDPLEGQEELGIFQILDKLEEVTEALLTRWEMYSKYFFFFRFYILGTHSCFIYFQSRIRCVKVMCPNPSLFRFHRLSKDEKLMRNKYK